MLLYLDHQLAVPLTSKDMKWTIVKRLKILDNLHLVTILAQICQNQGHADDAGLISAKDKFAFTQTARKLSEIYNKL